MEKTISMCWEIWKDRNTVRNEGVSRSGNTLARSSVAIVEEFRGAKERVLLSGPERHVRWLPPEPPRYKMNVDAAIFKDLRAMGAGMVLRDSQGLVLAAMSKRVPANLEALEAEAKAMEVAVQFAGEAGFREVYFETDSSTLKNILSGISEAPASIETITDNILAHLDNFHFVSFCHVKREGNRPAHILAQHAKYVGDFVVWLEETPNLIEDACSQDIACNDSEVL
ncbi:uncharacterized protein LOC115968497 [Quercus lobata]|uniref:uncharacterized protein LOC115968497 n=1 Tax=Quercus lobata TaxID=97700 RepID=UPI0012448FD8|nr:uncharacterized protein LOC115968497 [Quercus lobata]